MHHMEVQWQGITFVRMEGVDEKPRDMSHWWEGTSKGRASAGRFTDMCYLIQNNPMWYFIQNNHDTSFIWTNDCDTSFIWTIRATNVALKKTSRANETVCERLLFLRCQRDCVRETVALKRDSRAKESAWERPWHYWYDNVIDKTMWLIRRCRALMTSRLVDLDPYQLGKNKRNRATCLVPRLVTWCVCVCRVCVHVS